MTKTIIIRHRRENLRKCSLTGLESRPDMLFYTYPRDKLPSLRGYLLLTLDAPVLSPADAHFGIALLDGTWKRGDAMYGALPFPPSFEPRSLPPGLRTAYPRRQGDCEDPTRGLASVEALFAAYVLLGKDPSGLLDGYHWKKDFLEKNRELLFHY